MARSRAKTDIILPNFTLVSASAGSGKTTALTLRFLQLMMSARVPFNDLKNILAITFTHNAAAEMKQRILSTLKKASFGDKETLEKLSDVLHDDEESVSRRAEELVGVILDNYSDFQIQTIDSFIARVLQASSLEHGFPLDVELVLDSRPLLGEAFALLAAEAEKNESRRELLTELIDLVAESRRADQSFQWLPYEALRDEAGLIYGRLATMPGDPLTATSRTSLAELQGQIVDLICEIGDIAEASGYTINKRYAAIIEGARRKDYSAIISKSLGQSVLNRSKDSSFESVVGTIGSIQERLLKAVGEYYVQESIRHYQPYVRMLGLLGDKLEQVTRIKGQIDLSTATKRLAQSLHLEEVPEIYFSLGEQIHHYLIDEFQDTNPIQWKTLRPLVEHSLSGSGSLFLVGDTKQAIYSFRGGDWRIMARMIREDEFPSVPTTHETLSLNYRSGEAILSLGQNVFHNIVPKNVEHEEMASASGLATFEQKVSEEKRGKGYVSVESFDSPDHGSDDIPERNRILEIIADALNRGYALRDIYILTPRNDDVVSVSGWLNAANIRFLSHSSLDIRTRKVTQEILALLTFLDSPIDDLSFATVLLSDLFRLNAAEHSMVLDGEWFLFEAGKKPDGPLYTRFRREHPGLWESYFEQLFSVVGYLPLYDLTVEIYKTFRCFEMMPDEEATLIKLLEVVHISEGSGIQNVKEFLRAAEQDSENKEWDVAIAPGEDAVTIMTIHKAKGKESPIVITLLYDSIGRSNNLWLHEEEGGVRLYRITKDLEKHDPRLKQIVVEREILNGADSLNKLYVGLTRAKEESYILSVKSIRGKKPSCWLPESGYQLGKPTADFTEGTGTKPKKRDPSFAQLSHVPTRGIRQKREDRSIRRAERVRGELVHEILEGILLVEDDLDAQIDRRVREIDAQSQSPAEITEIQRAIVETVRLDQFRQLFESRAGRTVISEQDIVAPDGDLFRIDRMVIDEDLVTIIDFKTGGESESHQAQVRRYMELAGNLYPGKAVRGVLAYVDLRTVREVA